MRFAFLVVFFLSAAPFAEAQETPQNTLPNVLVVEATSVETLLNLPARRQVRDATTGTWRRAIGDVDAVELNVEKAALQSAPAALERLRVWLRAGGIVIVHNDAAQLFGFSTQPARLPSRDKGGQLFGFARCPLPMSALALLDGTSPRSPWGVRSVWYQLLPGDHLAKRPAQGLPLLRVEDLADLNPPPTPLYAAVLLPQGVGFVLFSPRLIEQHRGDGALYLQNLQQFLFANTPGREAPLRPYAIPSTLAAQLVALLPEEKPKDKNPGIQPLPNAKALAAAEDAERVRLAARAAELLPVINQVLEGAPVEETSPNSKSQAPAPLLAPRGEVLAVRAALRLLLPRPPKVPAPETKFVKQWRDALAAQGLLWQAQRAWQSNAPEIAEECIVTLEKQAPQNMEVLYWRGLLATQAGLEPQRAAPEAAKWLNKARDFWKRAATLPPLWSVLKTS